ncbi:MAG: PqqD family protein [Thermodesulfobacteriota bacterium]
MDFLLKYRPVENTVYREEEEGAFLFDPETGNLKYMNRSGRETYLMLNGRNDLNQVVQNMSDLYPDAESERLKQDVEAFIVDLEREKFISCLHENGPAPVV